MSTSDSYYIPLLNPDLHESASNTAKPYINLKKIGLAFIGICGVVMAVDQTVHYRRQQREFAKNQPLILLPHDQLPGTPEP